MLALALFFITLAASASAATKPYYCYLDRVDEYNHRAWSDQSDACAWAGRGDHCCDTFVFGGFGSCPAVSDEDDLNDLRIALAAQMKKDGQWEVTDQGQWKCNFPLLTTAISDRNVIMEWFAGLSELKKNFPEQKLSKASFSLDGDVVFCTHVC